MKKSEKKAKVLWLAMWAIMGAMFVYCIPASAEGFVMTENGETRELVSLGTYTITAYCPCRSCSGKWGRQTASGVTATPNHTIAAPKNIPFGTILVIDGVPYTVEDRGGAIKNKRLDIYYSDHKSALRYGKQRHEVFCYE